MNRPSLDEFNRAAQLDQDAMNRVDAAVMEHCGQDMSRYEASYDSLYREAVSAAGPRIAAQPDRSPKTDEELDAEIRAVMSEQNLTYYDAFIRLGNGSLPRKTAASECEGVRPVSSSPRTTISLDQKRAEVVESARRLRQLAERSGVSLTDDQRETLRKADELTLRPSDVRVRPVSPSLIPFRPNGQAPVSSENVEALRILAAIVEGSSTEAQLQSLEALAATITPCGARAHVASASRSRSRSTARSAIYYFFPQDRQSAGIDLCRLRDSNGPEAA